MRDVRSGAATGWGDRRFDWGQIEGVFVGVGIYHFANVLGFVHRGPGPRATRAKATTVLPLTVRKRLLARLRDAAADHGFSVEVGIHEGRIGSEWEELDSFT